MKMNFLLSEALFLLFMKQKEKRKRGERARERHKKFLSTSARREGKTEIMKCKHRRSSPPPSECINLPSTTETKKCRADNLGAKHQESFSHARLMLIKCLSRGFQVARANLCSANIDDR
jgi:hypothetical protein